MAGAFDGDERDVVAVARATDGRDFVKGIAGGWTDRDDAASRSRSRHRFVAGRRRQRQLLRAPRTRATDRRVVAPAGTSATSISASSRLV